MAETLSNPPTQTPLIETAAPLRGFITRSWTPWFDSLARAVRGLRAQATWNPGTVNANDTNGTTMTVPGAQMGDFVQTSFSLDLQRLQLSGHVQSANTVEVTLSNNSGAGVVIGSGTVYVRVRPRTL